MLSTTMSFFNDTSPERILNHFTNDVNTVDEMVPKSMLITIQSALCLVGTLVLIGIVNVWFLLSIALLTIPYVIMEYFHRNISLNLEGIFRQCITYVMPNYIQILNTAPVHISARRLMFTHMVASLDGLITIRTFQTEDRLLNEFDNLQDLHSGCCFTMSTVTTAFAFWLDCLTFLLLTSTTVTFVSNAIGI